MKTKTILTSCMLAATLLQSNAATNNNSIPAEGVTVDTGGEKSEAIKETPAERDARMAWWREAKFGLFIHWGVYSVPAGKYGDNTSYGEWIMNTAKIPVATYREFAAQFNPVKYNPELWAKTAKDAGMKYIVITSKHHDGFTLYPSAASKWNIADATPYKKDLLGPLVSAAKAEKLKIGFYYSQSQDWNNPGGAKSGFKEGEGWDDAHKGDYDAYLKNVAVPQVKEILTRYPIDILWWDTPMSMTPQRAAPLAALTKLRPGLIMNNRLGGGFGGDTETPEQFVPVTGYPGDWETCMTLNTHWGYNAYDHNWKSSTDLIRKLADICAKGGNLLLNVGPTAEGEFPPACIERLHDIGQWLRVNGDAIYGTSRSPFAYLPWGVATRKSSKLYLHVFDWPKDGKLIVPLDTEAKSATLLADGKKLSVKRADGKLVIEVPADSPDKSDSVIALELNGEPVVSPLPTEGAKVTASASTPGDKPANAIDGTGNNRWRAPLTEKSAWLEVELKRATKIGAFGLDEPDVWPRMKQKFTLEFFADGAWKKIAEGNTDGHGVKKSLTPVTAQKFRLTMECDKGSPGVAELQLYQVE
ncbi:MAG: alpha-L-fucosidase [Luteolibacter sp.]